MEYWNSTAELTGTGKPVDIVIAPVCDRSRLVASSHTIAHVSTFIPFGPGVIAFIKCPIAGRPLRSRTTQQLLMVRLFRHRECTRLHRLHAPRHHSRQEH